MACKDFVAAQDIAHVLSRRISERELKRDRERPTDILTSDITSVQLHIEVVVAWKDYVAAQDIGHALTRRTRERES